MSWKRAVPNRDWSAEETSNLQQAMAKGRRDGEDLPAFLERVTTEARGQQVGDRELPRGDREVGEEG